MEINVSINLKSLHYLNMLLKTMKDLNELYFSQIPCLFRLFIIK